MKQTRIFSVLTLFSLTLMSYSSVSARQFGYDGRDGHSGSSASNGRSGEDARVYAHRGRQFIDIAGQDASSNSQRGREGESATSCYQPRPSYNLYGADGGDGGRGGNGGNGGNGGDAVVFFKNLSDLANVQIDNSGGYGSEGASGAYGGRACRCEVYSWYKRHCYNKDVCKNVRVCRPRQKCRNEVKCRVINGVRKCSTQRVCETVQECHNERRCHQERRCEDRRYTCRDGREGNRGRDGSHGSKGSQGSIKIVKGLKLIPQVRSSARASIKSLVDRPVSLTQNVWRSAAGAKSLFAQGSNISDQYSEYIKTAYNEISAQWDSPKSIENFSDLGVSLGFRESGYASVSFTSDHLVDYEIERESEGHSRVIVHDVYKASDVSQLSESFTGRKRDLKIVIKDAASLSNTIKTGVHLNIQLGQFLGSKTLFNGVVPTEHMTITNNTITLHVGRFARDARKMRKNRKIKYSLSIKRSFGASSRTINLKRDKTTIR